MSRESRRLAGILLVILPTVIFGGVSILTLLVNEPSYMQNQLRQNLWRAGHAHAGVLLLLSLVALRYVDEATLSNRLKWIARHFIPLSAILLPAGFFFSVLAPDATKPNGLIYLAYAGAVILVIGLIVLGYGLIKKPENLAGD
jgi:high-affinity Fe2+/Pb2+ permease